MGRHRGTRCALWHPEWPGESCLWCCLLGLEMLPTGERLRHHTCLPENKPQLGQNPVVLLALTRPFNFAIFPASAAGMLGALSDDEQAVRTPWLLRKRCGCGLCPAGPVYRRFHPCLAETPAPLRLPYHPPRAGGASAPASAPGRARRARAPRDPWRRRVELRTLPPHVCRHSQSPPRGALGSARGRRRDWPRVAE